ncbi:RND transporter [Megasphaera cerevisiae DSM 20462]|jgi:multidrug efflux pump subunit AcrA (membrane-fusion protein)|uniref:RND transporter n=1 Tax=Megasphaera cerevisiae DSM 20462 TaxID=1122219 RepID=A0A0J6ZNK1_9FIRM|nr:efflux RND transporter periplasmic adaptor subunit [Megasphaera cerevisiae]KMO86471.1 RND transporter [Megasphaera cerevisiae DSM 20462]OKY53376.1 efflux transporter periplasmic adaptor subunit [Megasphaera cerevisiae]SJZ94580.1 membrane fusion protein, macrolide-specific efflux system [Megasphaera cerevisiae DSM 20462]
MKFDKRFKIALAVIAIAACAFGSYQYYQLQQREKQAAAIETADVVRKDLKSTVSATGTISPVDSVEVSPKITARISSVLVKENDKVTAGQTVTLLDGKDYEAKKDQAQYKVTNTKLNYDRAAYLYKVGAGTKQDLDDAKFNYDTAVSALSEAESDVAETVITAPMDGVVVGEPKTAGTMAVQGNSTPTVIMRIANTTQKQILAKIDETDIGKIKIGQEASFTVDAYIGQTFTARVSKISQTDTSNTWDTTDTTSSSSSSSSSSASVIYYYVTLDLDDPNDELRLGMTARVDINTSEKEDALVVPIAALKTNDKGSYVLRVNDAGQTEQVPVTTGIYSDEYVEILSGLTDGDKVSITYATSSKTSSSTKSSSSQRQGPPPM